MSQGFQQLVSVLESRYDFQSARTMAREALSAAGLKEQDKYSKDDLQKFVDGLSSVGSHLDRVWSLLGVAPSGAPAPAPPPAAEAKEEPPQDDGKKGDAKKGDDKKADEKKADDKKAEDTKDDGDDKDDDKKGKKK